MDQEPPQNRVATKGQSRGRCSLGFIHNRGAHECFRLTMAKLVELLSSGGPLRYASAEGRINCRLADPCALRFPKDSAPRGESTVDGMLEKCSRSEFGQYPGFFECRLRVVFFVC